MLLEYKTLFLIKTHPLPFPSGRPAALVFFSDFFLSPRQMLNYPLGRAKGLTLIAVFQSRPSSSALTCQAEESDGQVNAKLSTKL